VPAGGAGARSRGQASSPHPSARRAGSVTSSHRDKQIQVYDPTITGKQAMVQKSADQANKYVDSKKPGQNMLARQGAGTAGGGRGNSATRCQQQGTGGAVQQQGAGQPRYREDDGNSALARAGYQQQY
jgi:hypothetical protein